MLTDFHGRYTEQFLGNQTVCGEGGVVRIAWGVRRAREEIHDVDKMRTSSNEAKV
jgi:hypothetical protein